MLLDFEQELTTAGGQLFDAADGNSELGSIKYDLMAAGRDIMRGEPVYGIFKVHDANSDVGTSLDLEIISSDDSDGTGNVTSLGILSAVLVANLTRYSRHVVGPLAFDTMAATNRYITARVTTHGAAATAGKLKCWLQKGSDSLPQGVSD